MRRFKMVFIQSVADRLFYLLVGKMALIHLFFLNIGSFYEKMKDVQLTTVFKDKVVKFSSLTIAINFVRSLMITPDPRFSCFPVLAESHDNGEIICLNRVSGPIKPDGYYTPWNEQYRGRDC